MAEEKTTAERVRAIIAEILGKPVSEITDEKTFEELDADSLGAVETIMALEIEFDDIRLDDDGVTMASTVGDVVKLVEGTVNG